MITTILSFPLGQILLAKTEQGLCLAHYSQTKNNIRQTEDLLKIKGFSPTIDEAAFKVEHKLFNKYFDGQRVSTIQVRYSI